MRSRSALALRVATLAPRGVSWFVPTPRASRHVPLEHRVNFLRRGTPTAPFEMHNQKQLKLGVTNCQVIAWILFGPIQQLRELSFIPCVNVYDDPCLVTLSEFLCAHGLMKALQYSSGIASSWMNVPGKSDNNMRLRELVWAVTQECTQIGENGLSTPFWGICVHCCAARIVRADGGDAGVYTDWRKRSLDAVLGHLCTLLRRDSPRRQPTRTPEEPIISEVLKISICR